jgi:N-acetylmuramoyl-L-alanine amidase
MITYRIVIHSSATPEDREYTEDQLLRDHLARGFRTHAGYHFYIRRDGRVVRKRPMNLQGAHALPWNRDSWGICYEGGLEAGQTHWRFAKDTRTLEQKASILDCIYETIRYIINEVAEGVIKVDFKIEIIGHGQLPNTSTACPSFDAKSEYEWITA